MQHGDDIVLKMTTKGIWFQSPTGIEVSCNPNALAPTLFH